MRIIFLLTMLISMSVTIQAQTGDVKTSDGRGPLCIIGVVTENQADFTKVVDFLSTSKGITVSDYCLQHNLISLSFNKERYKELTGVFDYIECHFTGVKCFDKTMSRETYWKECEQELVKQ